MKKIFPVLITVVCLLFLSGCDMERIEAEHFQSVMEANQYEVIDVTYQIDGNQIQLVLLGMCETYQFEFYEFVSDMQAHSFFQDVRETFESNRESVHTTRSSSGGNFERFQQTSSGVFAYLLRVENIVIVVEADAVYRDGIRDIMDLLAD